MDYNYLTGIGKRELNEDVVLIEEINQSTNLFLVVDGMGGYQKGEMAAKIISENFATHLHSLSGFQSQDIENAFKKANLAIKQYNSENKIISGATVGGILITENKIFVFCFEATVLRNNVPQVPPQREGEKHNRYFYYFIPHHLQQAE